METKLFIGSSIIVGTAYLLILISFAKPLKLNGENITEFNHREASLVRSTLASIVDFIVSSSSDAQVKEFRRNEIRLRNSTANTLIYSQTPRYIVETVCLTLFTVFILLSISNQSSLIIFAKLGTLLLNGEQSPHTRLPQFLQWCLLLNQLNLSPQTRGLS